MPPDHGVTLYSDYGCGCQVCRAANADKSRYQRARRAASQPERNAALEHGTKSTSVNHGCCCELCFETQREANRRRPSRAQSGGVAPGGR